MPTTVITAPQSAAAAHGLIGSGFPSPVAPGDQRWELGFGFVAESCAEPESWVIPCVGPGSPAVGSTSTVDRGPLATGFLEWRPYVLRSSFRCDAQQLRAIDFEARARRVFELGESKLLETELYRGDAAGYGASVADPAVTPHNLTLVRGGTNLGVGGGQAPSLAIRTLIQAAAAAPGGPRAMIHATPAVATAWVMSGAVIEGRDGRLVTKVGGHTVIAGTGYTGSGPDNSDPGDPNIHWAWVTTPVYWLRGDTVEVLASIDQRTNDATVTVQRTACAYWDGCLHAGVPVDSMGVII